MIAAMLFFDLRSARRAAESIDKRHLTFYGVEDVIYTDNTPDQVHLPNDEKNPLLAFKLTDGTVVEDLSYENLKKQGLLSEENPYYQQSDLDKFVKTKKIDMQKLLIWSELHMKYVGEDK